MTSRPLSILALAGAVLWPLGASAQASDRGWYATLYGSYSRLGSTDLAESSLGSGLKASFDGGFGFGGAWGWRYGNGWAAELEWDYRRHNIGSLRDASGTTLGRDGDYASNILFVNAIYRLPARGGWTPLFGAGVGWLQEIDFDLEGGSVAQSYSRRGETGLQFIAGLERDLGRGWSLTGQARWLRVGKVTLGAEGAAGTLEGARYDPLSLHLGVTRRF